MAYFRCSTGSASSGDGVALVVQCDANFAGSVITATNGTDTFTETCPSVSPYTVRFEGIPTGTYTISGVSQGQTFTTQFTVLDYETTLTATPDGATVLPINDIQIWLHCANIWDKNYTTLDEVLADNTTLLALISSNNAVDYMVRSTDFAGQDYNLVPIMTSDTTPSGEVIYSSVYGNNYGWYAFGQNGINDSYFWNGKSSDANAYIGYHFTNPVVITKMVFQAPKSYTCNFRNASIQGSNDGTTWVDLKTNITDLFSLRNASVTHTFNNNIAYSYYRLYEASNGEASQHLMAGILMYGAPGIVDNQTAMGYIGNNDYCADTLLADATWSEAICNSEYFESVLNVKVPTMTSDTTPSGRVLYSSQYSGEYGYYPFDGNNVTQWSTASSTTNPAYIGYMFASAVNVKKIHILYGNGGALTFKLQYSDDGSTWTDIGLSGTISPSLEYDFSNINNSEPHRYWRLYLTSTVNNYYSTKTLQFYGRA